MKLDTPIAFLATDDAEASKGFYQDVLGLELIADEPFALVFRTGVVVLRIQKLDVFKPVPYTVFGWDVDDIYATIATLESRGVEFEDYEQIEQDEQNVWETPGGARVAWFRDPVGNLLSLTQP